MLFGKQQIDAPDGYAHGYGAVSDVENGPSLHNKVGEIAVEEIGYTTECQTVDQVADCASEDKSQREADCFWMCDGMGAVRGEDQVE